MIHILVCCSRVTRTYKRRKFFLIIYSLFYIFLFRYFQLSFITTLPLLSITIQYSTSLSLSSITTLHSTTLPLLSITIQYSTSLSLSSITTLHSTTLPLLSITIQYSTNLSLLSNTIYFLYNLNYNLYC